MEIKVIRSARKTMELQIKGTGEVILRAPLEVSSSEISAFAESRKGWIIQHLEKVKKEQERRSCEKKFTEEELQMLTKKARKVIPERTEYFAREMGLRYEKITIRRQKTRWGSCSSKGNLNFNCLLMLTPPEVLDYVVVHELCHLKEMNHSPRFWKEVEMVMPDYPKQRKWLRDNGKYLIERLP